MRQIIDHKQVRRNRSRAAALAAVDAAYLFERALDDLEERLATVNRSFEQLLFLGPVHEDFKHRLEALAHHVSYLDALPDGEIVEPDNTPQQGFDLIVSLFVLHETNDTPGVLIQLNRLMRPDGLLICCFPGAGTLGELRDSLLHGDLDVYGGAQVRILPFMDVRDAGALLQRAGFALPVTDIDEVRVRYGRPLSLLHDLRAMGATNTLVARARKFTSGHVFQKAFEHYASHHADDDGKLGATFNLIWMSGWAPDSSQPKPLKPGSATMSLKDALESK